MNRHNFPESEYETTFEPLVIGGDVSLTAGATVAVSTHTRLQGINPSGSCESRVGIVTFKQHGYKVSSEGGGRIPNIIPVVICNSCDAKAFPIT